MSEVTLTVALIADVFHGDDGPDRLIERLREAASQGATLACIPEVPLNGWAPASQDARDDDAEPPEGPRWRAQSEAARAAGIGLVGGAIIRDPETGVRHNTALIFDSDGDLRARYQKLHIPQEPGFWEGSHYEPGTMLPDVINGFAMPIGVQVCSDNNRPVATHILAARGAEAIFVPRATTRSYLEQWMASFKANALTTGSYVLSCNRPVPEGGTNLGGPTIVVAPDGQVVVESEETVVVTTLSRQAVASARADYPGYLQVRADIYAKAWAEIARESPGSQTRSMGAEDVTRT